MQDKYPGYEIVSDVASGLNFERKGLKAILRSALQGDVETIAVAHKDRLARFGYPILEFILQVCVLGRSSVLLLIASIEETSESRRASYHGIIETVTRRIHEKNRRLEYPARASIDSRLKFLGRFSITGAFDPGLEQLAGRRSH
jgi:hypothetical protein